MVFFKGLFYKISCVLPPTPFSPPACRSLFCSSLWIKGCCCYNGSQLLLWPKHPARLQAQPSTARTRQERFSPRCSGIADPGLLTKPSWRSFSWQGMVSLPPPTDYFLYLLLLGLYTLLSPLPRGCFITFLLVLFPPFELHLAVSVLIVSGPVCSKVLVSLQTPHTAQGCPSGMDRWTEPPPALQTKLNKLTHPIWSGVCTLLHKARALYTSVIGKTSWRI